MLEYQPPQDHSSVNLLALITKLLFEREYTEALRKDQP